MFDEMLFTHLIGSNDTWDVLLSPSTPFVLKHIFFRDLILVQHQYNNCTTTPHMRVGPSMWDPPSCEGLLYSCCIGVVNLTFSFFLIQKGCWETVRRPHVSLLLNWCWDFDFVFIINWQPSNPVIEIKVL
jgi:hypothetical protein